MHVSHELNKGLRITRTRRLSIILSLLSLCSFPHIVYSEPSSDMLEVVTLDETRKRHYVHLDYFGEFLVPESRARGERDIRVGDQIQVRYYPTRVASLKNLGVTTPKPLSASGVPDTRESLVLFPPDMPDTFSVAEGYGSVTVALKGTAQSKLGLAVRAQPSGLLIGESVVTIALMSELLACDVTRDENLTKQMHDLRYDEQWQVFVFEATLARGVRTIEVYQLAGNQARLVARAGPVAVGPIHRQVSLSHKVDASSPSLARMERDPQQAFFDGIVQINQSGVHELKVVIDYEADSWAARQSLIGASHQTLSGSSLRFIVHTERVRPGNLRARVGYAAFDRAREGRLIANFVLIRNPRGYFSENTAFFERLNPTTGLQIGGTGEKDVVFLLGLSLKIIDQADVVAGLRFGRESNSPWVLKNNFYFGATLDPGLFNWIKTQQ